MREVLVCPICQSTHFKPTLSCKDYTVSGENFTVTQCTKCNFRATSPAPENKDLGGYYQSINYISHTSKASTLIDKLYLLARSYTLNWKLNIISDNLINSTNKTLLDYGCGTGEFLQKCKSHGWQVHGIEPSPEARIKAEANNNQSIATSIEQITSTDFQIITLWHVLEHVPELNQTLIALRNRLHPNGRLIVALPNPNSLDAKHYKNHWAAYDVPRHLWHFSQHNAENLLRNNGFTLISKNPMPLDSFYVSLLSEKYQRNGKTNMPGLIKAFLTAARSNVDARKTGEYSSIIYIAKK